MKGDYYVDPIRSSDIHEYLFANSHSPGLRRIPITSVLGKLYVFPRFAKFPQKVLTVDDLGAPPNFSFVEEWIGVLLRHI